MTTATEEVKTETVPDSFETSIGSAVEAAMERRKAQGAIPENKPENEDAEELQSKPEVETDEEAIESEGNQEEDLSPEGEIEQEDDSPVTGDEEPEEVETPEAEITDELLERAVKAGMSMRNARKFPDAEALEEAIGLLSGVSSEGEKEEVEEEETVSAESEIDQLLAQVQINPEEYDDDLVKSFDTMKGLISKLAKQNQELLTQANASGFDANLAGLDETASKIVRDNPDKKQLLKRKFDALQAGYKATGEKLSDAEVLKEAVQMALSADIAKAKTDTKAKQAEKRQSQRIVRPSGKKVEQATSARDDAVQLLKEKFKNLS